MGALSRGERTEYEAHLATCRACARAVAELAPLPGLLGRLAPDDAELLLAPASEPPASIATPRVVPLSLWRRTSVRIGLLAAAAAVVAGGVAVPVSLHHSDQGAAAVALQSATGGSVPLTASVRLRPTDWGTEIDMTCVYGAGYGGPEQHYSLYVLDAAGHATLVSSWHVAPGETAKTTGSTGLDVADIAQVQVRAPDGTVLLAAHTAAT
jgi:hypothetical protein